MRVTSCVLGLTLLSLPAFAQDAVGELYASDASVRGSMMLTATGTRVMSGSQVAAGTTPAVLRLARGGELRICPQTSIAVSQGQSQGPLSLGLNVGAMEMHYKLQAFADALITPDFRIQLAGPGEFHIAVGADKRGNTCVKSLEGNTSAVIVSEMMGNGTYQVSPGWSIIFLGGNLKNSGSSSEPCGCPEPKPQPTVVATNTAPATSEKTAAAAPSATTAMPTNPAPTAATPSNVAVEADAPLVYRPLASADTSHQEMREIATLRTRKITSIAELQPSTVVRPATLKPAKATQERKGFFGKLGTFFAKVFKG